MRRRWPEDFEEFVAARWPDMVLTAHVVCGDPAVARDVATAALTDVGTRWRSVADEGSPGARAHTAMLLHLEANGSGHGRRPPCAATAVNGGGGPPDTGSPEPAGPGRRDDAESHAALLEDLAGGYAELPVRARTVLALQQVEGLRPEECATTLDLPLDDVLSAVDRAAADLASADARARARLRLPADPGAGAGDVSQALQDRARGADVGGDPIALVTAQRAARRRHTARLSAGATAAAAVVAVGVAALAAAGDGGAARTPPTVTASTSVLADASRWPARGALAADLEVRRVVARDWGVNTRLLYAGVFDGSRIVVGWQPSQAADHSQIKVLAGPSGQPLADVETRSFDTDSAPGGLAVLGIPTSTSVPLVVLGRPDVTQAETSVRVSYDPSGRVIHHWMAAALQGGVGEVELPVGVVPGQPLLPALRVRLDGYDGPATNQDVPDLQLAVPSCPDCSRSAWAARTTAAAVARLAAATGLDETAISTQTLALGTVPRLELPATTAGAPVVGRGDLACTLYRLPSGTTLTSSALRVRTGATVTARGSLDLVPRGGAARRPCLQIVSIDLQGMVHYVFAAPLAAAAQLAPASTTSRPPEPVAPLTDQVGVLTSPPNVVPQQEVLRTLDAQNHTLETYPFLDLVEWHDPFEVRPRTGL